MSDISYLIFLNRRLLIDSQSSFCDIVSFEFAKGLTSCQPSINRPERKLSRNTFILVHHQVGMKYSDVERVFVVLAWRPPQLDLRTPALCSLGSFLFDWHCPLTKQCRELNPGQQFYAAPPYERVHHKNNFFFLV